MGGQIAGARTEESQSFRTLQIGANGRPVKPHFKTLNVNLVGAMYSACSSSPWCLPPLKPSVTVPATATQLALHYLPKTRHPTEPFKSVVFLGCLGPSDLVAAEHSGFVWLMMMSLESIMGCTPESRDLCHFSAWVTRLCESNPTGSHIQWDSHRNGAIGISSR